MDHFPNNGVGQPAVLTYGPSRVEGQLLFHRNGTDEVTIVNFHVYNEFGICEFQGVANRAQP